MCTPGRARTPVCEPHVRLGGEWCPRCPMLYCAVHMLLTPKSLAFSPLFRTVSPYLRCSGTGASPPAAQHGRRERCPRARARFPRLACGPKSLNAKKAGTHVGRVAVRASGSFNIQSTAEVVQGIAHRHCRLVQRGDGYGYSRIARPKGDAGFGTASLSALSLPGQKAEVSRAA